MSPQELNLKLVAKAESAIRHLYGESGKFAGGRFCIGNAQGDPGDSMFVYLKDGRFKDSSTGDRGDLLELFSLKMGSKEAGIDAAYSFLGITKRAKKEKLTPWKKPKRDWSQLTENPSVLQYLTVDRKLSIEVLQNLNVRARDDEFYTFLTYTHDAEPKVCGANYCSIIRKKVKDKLKKEIFQSDQPLATLFGHPVCKRNLTNHEDKTFFIVTEGQIDCMSYWTQGFKNAVSVPFGSTAHDWIENSWEFILSFDECYLCFDNDESGMAEMEKIAKRIGYERCKRIVKPSHLVDANDCLREGVDLGKLIDSAEDFKPSKLIEASEIHGEAIHRMSLGRREQQGIPFCGWIGEDSIEFRIRPKEMTIYTGFPSSGKSNLLYQEVAYLVFVMGQAVVIASLEEDAEDILGLIMIHALAMQYNAKDERNHNCFMELKALMKKKIFFYHHRNRAPFLDVLQTAEFVIRKHGAQHFIMDSVAKTDLNIENNEDANKFMGEITTSMNQTGAHYHVVAHARKGPDKNKWEMPGMNEIKGANCFSVETFNIIVMWRDPKKTEMLQEFRKNGFYEKKIWGDSAPAAKPSGGYQKYGNGPKIVKMDLEEIQEYPDSILWVNKQKVGGVTGKFDLFYNAENNRMSCKFETISKPYAIEVYEKFYQREDRAEF